MPVELTIEQQHEEENLQLEDEWTPEPRWQTDLIFDDGSQLESNRHRIAMNALIEAVTLADQGREDYFAGGNMFVDYSPNNRPPTIKSPTVVATGARFQYKSTRVLTTIITITQNRQP